MSQCETVKIKHPDGFAIINESDFVKGEHELFAEVKKPVQRKAKAKPSFDA